ncbi:MAG TPA: hypothetical protein PKZ01_10955 [Candidatus Hydrogenedentes bacterium]|nr:hypothetical protein [Candidatus Hydrogenedentota bacterium]
MNAPRASAFAAYGQESSPGSLRFWGTRTAELFSREVSESFSGVLERNYYSRFEGDHAGFVSASIDDRPWTGAMWTRDTGVFLRELVQWGYLEHACLTTKCLIRLVRENSEGFFTFPEYFQVGQPGSGGELDGTNAILIGMVLLWRRLPSNHPVRETIQAFLCGPKSPVAYMEHALRKAPLLPGSGEFGGGCGIPGQHYNIVQNYLGVYALTAVAHVHRESGDAPSAERVLSLANAIEQGVEKHLVAPDGSWHWCVDIATMQPDPAIVDHPINKGFGGLNGVAAMSSDVLGFLPDAKTARWLRPSLQTFDKLARTPLRKDLFEKHGIWTQFDEPPLHRMMSPSYGHGYALQTMLLFDRMDWAERALNYLAEATFQPPRGYKLDRDNPYHFYERYVAPETPSLETFDQGCGALNLVCVVEPIKVARLVAGCDDTRPSCLRFVPRVPASWRGYEMKRWPVHTAAGVSQIDVFYERDPDGERFRVDLVEGPRIPKMEIFLGGPSEKRRAAITDVIAADLRL